jgi:hypothetical protein
MTVKTKADIQKLGGVFTDEEIVDDDFTISNFANGRRSAYVLGIKL